MQSLYAIIDMYRFTLSHIENDRDVNAWYIISDACYRTRNFCVFSRVQKRILGLTHKAAQMMRFEAFIPRRAE